MATRDFSITVDIDAPPERVWEVISDFERWPEWTPSVRSIQRLDTGSPAPGSRVRIKQPKLPDAVWELTAFEADHSFTWKTGSLGVYVTARHSVEAAGRGSRATLSLRFEGSLSAVVARLTSRLNDRYLKLEAAGLKRRSEGRVDP